MQTTPLPLPHRILARRHHLAELSVLYLIFGVSMGIAMGASQNFTLRPVHAHINLLGWTTMALAGLIYSVFPKAGESRLARLHFWLMNLALPVMMVALALRAVRPDGLGAGAGARRRSSPRWPSSRLRANLFLNLKQLTAALPVILAG